MEPDEKILRKLAVIEKVGLSGPTIWRREQKGDFPKRISLGGASVGWLQSEVDQWVRQKAENRPLSSSPEAVAKADHARKRKAERRARRSLSNSSPS
jgi:prophage regulatory protein